VGAGLNADEQDSIDSLRERLRRLEAAVEASGIGIWEWDVPTGVLTWNARNRELLGVTPDQSLMIQDYLGQVHPDDLEAVRAVYRAVADRPHGGELVFEFRARPGPDGASRWLQQRGRVEKDAQGIRRVVGATLDITDRKTIEQRRNLVFSELAHRARNGFTIIMTIVSQTARNATDVKAFADLLMARLHAMVDSQDLVTEVVDGSLPFGDLLSRALTPFDASRFDIGPGVREIHIANDAVVAFALLLHELSTNAVKYGALSSQTGRVRLSVVDAPEGEVHLRWQELGGPPVSAPSKRGFGTRLLDVSLRNNDGRVAANFDVQGFQADIHFPMGQP
jgi:PAS domain S-box-containing protein